MFIVHHVQANTEVLRANAGRLAKTWFRSTKQVDQAKNVATLRICILTSGRALLSEPVGLYVLGYAMSALSRITAGFLQQLSKSSDQNVGLGASTKFI